MRLNLKTNFIYTDRVSKAYFVYDKYKEILQGDILDVGADECSLKTHLPSTVKYVGVGLGNNPDLVQLDLELPNGLPFERDSFDCVLCLDVLEHLENIHFMFDELCRVSRKYVLVSLPNPWRAFMTYLEQGPYKDDKNIKFYGLPKEREPDRHKWFFSPSEGRAFIEHRSKKNSMKIIDIYIEMAGQTSANGVSTEAMNKARSVLFRNNVAWSDLYEGTQWYLLEKS